MYFPVNYKGKRVKRKLNKCKDVFKAFDDVQNALGDLYASFTTRATTSGPKLSKIPVPIIPIEEQQRIIEILDKYNVLCAGISSGLPINKVPPPWATLWIFALSTLVGLYQTGGLFFLS